MSESKYKHLSQKQQILARPGRHIGDITNHTETVWLCDVIKNKESESHQGQKDTIKILEKDINNNQALIHLFYEILVNAQDNALESNNTDVPCKKIEITVTNNSVTIWNDGMWIKIQKHKYAKDEENVGDIYEHELIFGVLNSSSNYDEKKKKRIGAGLHGEGGKLVNLFSKKFEIESCDPDTSQIYKQTWENNMSKKSKPKITKTKRKTGYTQVTFLPDFERFGLTEFSQDHISLMRKLAVECSLFTGVKTIFNGFPLKIKNLEQYVNNYIPDNVNKISFVSEDSQVVICEKQGNNKVKHFCYVNGIFNSNGGVHYNEWSKAIFTELANKLKKKLKQEINIKLQNYFWIFINCQLVNPEFKGQTKDTLLKPTPHVNVKSTKINKILDWPFVEKIATKLKLKNLTQLKKTNGKIKSGPINIPNADDAVLAGKQPDKCTLILTEGDSGKTLAVKFITTIDKLNCRKYYGILPLRGKFLNVRNATEKQIKDNVEINSLNKLLGLQHGVDYSILENRKSLRYNKLLIMTDQDPDGDHIKGLIINYFDFYFNGLLQCNLFLETMKTPIVKVITGKKHLIFKYMQAFKKWKENNPNTKFKSQYYKGLGTIDDTELHEIFDDSLYTKFVSDSMANESIDMIFNENRSNDRKKWLEEYKPNEFIYPIKAGKEIVPISDFFNNEMIGFSIYDNERSLPNIIDGLKVSQRKALFTGLKQLNYTNFVKVFKFAGDTIGLTDYHHGPVSMEQAIIKMTQSFVGSNNISYFTGHGQFGTRLEGGKDHSSSRYTFVKLSKITRKLFRKEDDPILEYNFSEENQIEPKFFVPIIPTLLINGSRGIGTGYSATIPNFNPIDLCNIVKLWIDCHNNKQTFALPEIKPFYQWFTGKIKKNGNQFIYYGSFNFIDDDTVEITELPIGTWNVSFRKSLDSMIESGIITHYHELSDAFNVRIRVYLNNKEKSEKSNKNTKTRKTVKKRLFNFSDPNFKLMSKESITNITGFIPSGGLKKLSGLEEIINLFCETRLNYYSKRKNYLIKKLELDLLISENKYRFIKMIIPDPLIMQRTESQLCKLLENENYFLVDNSFNYLINLPIRTMNTDNLLILEKEIDSIKAEISYIKKTSLENMWLKEIDEFLDSYNTYIQELRDIREKILKPKSKKK